MALRISHGLLASLIALACETAPGRTDEAAETWITEAGYEIGGALEGDALFSWVSNVKVSADGRRVFVLESSIERLTVWSPEGLLLLDLGGRGEGPGEFLGARTVGLAKTVSTFATPGASHSSLRTVRSRRPSPTLRHR